MKKYNTCYGCKASIINETGYDACKLGFKTKPGRIFCGAVVDNAPAEPCLKTKSMDIFLDLLKKSY